VPRNGKHAVEISLLSTHVAAAAGATATSCRPCGGRPWQKVVVDSCPHSIRTLPANQVGRALPSANFPLASPSDPPSYPSSCPPVACPVVLRPLLPSNSKLLPGCEPQVGTSPPPTSTGLRVGNGSRFLDLLVLPYAELVARRFELPLSRRRLPPPSCRCCPRTAIWNSGRALLLLAAFVVRLQSGASSFPLLLPFRGPPPQTTHLRRRLARDSC
jgi:hypothetical protein